jgi:hypothetical protein
MHSPKFRIGAQQQTLLSSSRQEDFYSYVSWERLEDFRNYTPNKLDIELT